MDAFDTDVLVYAATPGHPLGERVRSLFPDAAMSTDGAIAGIGSVLLIPELMTKPIREHAEVAIDELTKLLARLDLRPVDESIARSAATLGAHHRLRAADAVHLATAVAAGADRFITNNSSDFSKSIDDIEIIYPADLA